MHHEIVIVGGGTAGIRVAALLRRAGRTDIAIVEPSTRHFYQPLWTLVGAGVARKEETLRDEVKYIPAGVAWLNDAVVEIDPDRNSLTTASGDQVGYDFLVLAPGLKLDWDAIPGLREAIVRPEVSTNYEYDLAPKTWDLIRKFKGGTALFHMPGTPIKCPGAPQKITYLAADYFRRHGVADAGVIYCAGTPSIYGIAEYAAVLNGVLDRYKIDARFNYDLVEIRANAREAIFRRKGDASTVAIPYDIMHVVPPQTAPDFIRRSSLADPSKPEGWVKVDKFTMINPDHPNVFALGDAAGTPNAKTGAAACKQAVVVANNLLSAIAEKEPTSHYDGYVACPIVTGYGRMLLCEFDYGGKPTPTVPFIDTLKERRDMWLLKRYGLPWMYWHLALKGRSIPFLRPSEAVAPLSVDRSLGRV